ncbi:UBX domain-containing protein 6 [Leptodactylus fuscus]|uniref:UBX domain-containing protein 6 n=1 Tax=Leptodactylus fuscus TaxID=238119 RepID=UPI003F4EA7DE
MKKLFEGFKSDIKFRGAGPGRRLDTEAREIPDNSVKERPAPRRAPTGEAQRAAASAAIARFDSKQTKVKTLCKDTVNSTVKDVDFKQEDVMPNKKSGTVQDSVCNIMFRCPLTGEILKKEEVESHMKKSIEMLSSADPISASIMKIHTFNKDREKVKLGVETMARYLKNIIGNTNEEKYQKIKLSNKVFQEKVICLEGAHEFFEAVGFEKKTLALQGQDLQEEFYVLDSDALNRLTDLQKYHDSLLSGEPLIATLDRQPQIFMPSVKAATFDLPADFYNLTIEEIRLEQKLRTEKLKQDSMLKTKEMREREEKQERKKYKYTFVRIRFPDGYVLQGLFYGKERLSILVDFIRQHLQNDWIPFELIAPCGQKLENEALTLSECGLVPTALLTFRWDEGILADMENTDGYKTESVLKQDLLSSAKTFT